MPISAQLSGHKTIEVKITNTSQEGDDERKRGPRYEYLDPRKALALIKQLVCALDRLDNR